MPARLHFYLNLVQIAEIFKVSQHIWAVRSAIQFNFYHRRNHFQNTLNKTSLAVLETHGSDRVEMIRLWLSRIFWWDLSGVKLIKIDEIKSLNILKFQKGISNEDISLLYFGFFLKNYLRKITWWEWIMIPCWRIKVLEEFWIDLEEERARFWTCFEGLHGLILEATKVCDLWKRTWSEDTRSLCTKWK